MIVMLNGIGNCQLNANSQALLDTKVFGIQLVRTSIVLSEVQFKKDGRSSYHQIRSAKAPIVYEERNKWLRIFEILHVCWIEKKKRMKSKVRYE